ncbi:MAG: type pilus assembly protein PilC [Clostridiales bacterium]|jgi:type IV pilus assembly protein PilC|nr:type pilus assembly protein PilC [Clostridiales bacterium]
MPLYAYKGVNIDGAMQAGQYEAVDKDAVMAMLRERGYYPVEVKPIRDKRSGDWLAALQRVPLRDISVFCKQFSAVIKAGIPIVQALDIMREQVTNKSLKEALGEIYQSVQVGKALSDSMEEYPRVFPAMLVEMVRVGEVSGTLDTSLERMADTYEKQYKLQQKVSNAMVYPAVVCVVAIAVVIFMLIFVVPTFVSMFTDSGMELPLPTRILLGLSGFVQNYAVILLLIIAVLALILFYYVSTDVGRRWFDGLKLKVPVVKDFMIRSITANFAQILSTLLASGIDINQALDIAKGVIKNKVVEGHIDKFIEDVEQGVALADTIGKAGLFPVMLVQMTRIGEESGSLDAMLAQTAQFYETEAENAATRLTSLIEPAIIVVLGLAIGFIVISIALPMFTMISTVPAGA